MVKRQGPFGEFMACQDFPNCKNTKKVPRNQEDIARTVTAFAEDGSELDPDKLHLAQKLLKYYHFCTKASFFNGLNKPVD